MSKLANWFNKNAYTFNQVGRELWQQKFLSFLTILVIACSITLPTFSYLLWKNSQAISNHFPQINSHITLFLKQDISEEETNQLLTDLKNKSFIQDVHYISPQEGLNTLKSTGLNVMAKEFTVTSLPAAIMVQLKSDTPFINFVEIRHELRQMKGVDQLKWEEELWQKLDAITSLFGKVAWISLALMLLTLLFIITYSIRSEVFYQKKQIEVMQLLGATASFIIRPFLIKAIFFMVSGTLLGCTISALLLNILNSNTLVISTLFQFPFKLLNLSGIELLSFILLSALLGYICALLTTLRYIGQLNRD